MQKSNKTNSFVKQATILAGASFFVRFLGFLYRLPLTNLIGDEGNGIYSAGFYLYNFFLVMSSAGLPVAISKIISENIALGRYKNANKVFKVALIISSISGLFFSLVMFFSAKWFSNVINSPKSYYTILTLSPTVFIVSLISVFRGYFQGFGTTTKTAISQIIEQIFNAIFSILLAYLLVDFGIEFGAAGATFATGIGAFFGLIYILYSYLFNKKKYIKIIKTQNTNNKIQSFKKICKIIIKTAIPIIAGTAIFSITNLIDMQMVNTRLKYSNAFSDEQITSLYGQLTGKYVTLTTLPVSISTAIATAVIPSISSSFIKKEGLNLKRKILTSLRLTMIISIPASVGMGVLSNQILELLFPNYSEGAALLKAGALSIIFLALYQILTGILQGIGKLSVPAINAFIGAIFKIILNYFLIAIPSINVIGSIIGTTVCYIVASILNILALKKSTKIKISFKNILIKPLIASLFMGISCFFVYKFLFFISNINSISTIITIFISMFIYIICLGLLKGFKRNDLKLVPLGSKFIKILDKFNLLN